jgi:hypothetical protein
MAGAGCRYIGTWGHHQHQAWWHCPCRRAATRGGSSQNWPGNHVYNIVVHAQNIAHIMIVLSKWSDLVLLVFHFSVSSHWRIPSCHQKDWSPSLHWFNMQAWWGQSYCHCNRGPLFLREGGSFGGLNRGCWPFPDGESPRLQNVIRCV